MSHRGNCNVFSLIWSLLAVLSAEMFQSPCPPSLINVPKHSPHSEVDAFLSIYTCSGAVYGLACICRFCLLLKLEGSNAFPPFWPWSSLSNVEAYLLVEGGG